MISYTKRYVNIVSIIITILIYFFLINSNFILKKINFNPLYISSLLKKDSVIVELNSNNINQETKEISKNQSKIPLNNTKENKLKDYNWKIIIPKISLEAPIYEGTSKEVMNEYVGHFEETSSNSGNIGLAAHNRGYKVNYFANIKLLRYGDEIIYKFNDIEKKYTVVNNIIIKDTDWSYLQNTEENKITLITCVENEPEYRRCIQAVEKACIQK